MDEIEGGLGDDGEGDLDDEESVESEESEESECEDEVYACKDPKFFENSIACEGCEDLSETARSLVARY